MNVEDEEGFLGVGCRILGQMAVIGLLRWLNTKCSIFTLSYPLADVYEPCGFKQQNKASKARKWHYVCLERNALSFKRFLQDFIVTRVTATTTAREGIGERDAVMAGPV